MQGLIDKALGMSATATLAVMALAGGPVLAAGEGKSSVNMSPGVTNVGQSIFDLHMIILWICVVIGVAVFAVMFYSIIYHRKSKGVVPAQFHESTKVEI